MKPRFAAVAFATIAAFTNTVGCDDVTPLEYVAPPRDAALADRVDPSEVAACRDCATAPGSICRPAFDACQAQDSRCAQLLDCLTESNCWRQLNQNNFGDPPPCAVSCLSAASVSSINEIGVPATQFYVCIVDPARCNDACFGNPGTAGDQ